MLFGFEHCDRIERVLKQSANWSVLFLNHTDIISKFFLCWCLCAAVLLCVCVCVDVLLVIVVKRLELLNVSLLREHENVCELLQL